MLMSSVDANIMFAPPLLTPLTEVNLTGEGNAIPALRSRSDANVTFAPHPYPLSLTRRGEKGLYKSHHYKDI